ncbi:MAG: hypothetical protein QM520_02460 [Gammaproteobacteria bacterium]|nr:hypothetical protein [Gammaproteobacteria bacterium]
MEKSIAGMPAGALMYISTPLEIDAYIKTIPRGQSVSIQQMRDHLAKINKADCTCPLTTGIFLRIVAEAAFEQVSRDESANLTPFWRVIDPKSSIVKKLSFDSTFIQHMRNDENIV